jgi:hypothetical protein
MNWIFGNVAKPALNIMTIGAVLAGLYAIGYGTATAIGEQVVAYRHDESWNKRGYIKCVNGSVSMGNIDLEGLQLPIDLDKLCSGL